MLGILLFLALFIADIVRIFKDSDEFDGVMLFARPVAAFIGTLLCGGTFWQALLCGIIWGFFGFIVAMLISEHFGNSADEDTVRHSTYIPPSQKSSQPNSGGNYTAPTTGTPVSKTPPTPKQPKQDNAPTSATTPSVTPTIPSGTFEFSPHILPEQDARFHKARVSNGVVYYRFSSGSKPIGYYELIDNGTRVNIYRTFDKGLIGYTLGNEIFLSREGLYNDALQTREKYGNSYPINKPSPMVLNLAEIRGNVIKDNFDHEILGNFSGDPFAAAAAFVCLIYECHTEYKYQLFYKLWEA